MKNKFCQSILFLMGLYAHDCLCSSNATVAISPLKQHPQHSTKMFDELMQQIVDSAASDSAEQAEYKVNVFLSLIKLKAQEETAAFIEAQKKTKMLSSDSLAPKRNNKRKLEK